MLKRGSGAQNPVSLFAFFSRAVLHGDGVWDMFELLTSIFRANLRDLDVNL